MGFLDKAKNAAEQAAARAKEGVEEVQTNWELMQAYHELGKVTYRLVQNGELSNPEVTALVDRIRALEARSPADTGMAGATATTTTEPPPSDQPPTMPT